MDAIEVANRLKSGPVFLRSPFEDTVIRTTTTGKFFARLSGGREYKVDHSTKMVNDAILEWDEITEAEYQKF